MTLRERYARLAVMVAEHKADSMDHHRAACAACAWWPRYIAAVEDRLKDILWWVEYVEEHDGADSMCVEYVSALLTGLELALGIYP